MPKGQTSHIEEVLYNSRHNVMENKGHEQTFKTYTANYINITLQCCHQFCKNTGDCKVYDETHDPYDRAANLRCSQCRSPCLGQQRFLHHCSVCSLTSNEVADWLPLFNTLFLVLQVKWFYVKSGHWQTKIPHSLAKGELYEHTSLI
jgi:hypothetical protein